MGMVFLWLATRTGKRGGPQRGRSLYTVSEGAAVELFLGGKRLRKGINSPSEVVYT